MALKLAWATDIHLNFINADAIQRWCRSITASEPDAILISGDIAEARDIEEKLARMGELFARPLYFVLGNHDYYHGSIAGVRERVKELVARSRHLVWLDFAEGIALTDRVGLVGHGGWGDASHGDFMGSSVVLNDYILIEELARIDQAERERRLRGLGHEAAAHIREVLPGALDRFESVILVTHVPPFRGACWHEGKISDGNWLPHFTCKAMGDAIVEIMSARQERSLRVYCGHTHSGGEYWPLPNVCVRTGGADYGKPAAQPPILIR